MFRAIPPICRERVSATGAWLLATLPEHPPDGEDLTSAKSQGPRHSQCEGEPGRGFRREPALEPGLEVGPQPNFETKPSVNRNPRQPQPGSSSYSRAQAVNRLQRSGLCPVSPSCRLQQMPERCSPFNRKVRARTGLLRTREWPSSHRATDCLQSTYVITSRRAVTQLSAFRTDPRQASPGRFDAVLPIFSRYLELDGRREHDRGSGSRRRSGGLQSPADRSAR
jgi:hypothetical protein